MKYIGAHFSAAKGFDHLVETAQLFEANSFALFTKPAVQWHAKIITENVAESFKSICSRCRYDSNMILAHASYLINMGNPIESKRDNAKKAFIDEMRRCSQLGIRMLNFHPGSYMDGSIGDAIQHIGFCLRDAIESVPDVMPVVETMAGQGTCIGSELAHIRDIIAASGCEDKIGVCIDTCHSFAAGYDIRTEDVYEKFISTFDEVIGLAHLRGMHLNDSKKDLGSKVDRHEALGDGKIGIDAFRFIMQDKRTDGIPLILETPDCSRWRQEIALLKSFIDKAVT